MLNYGIIFFSKFFFSALFFEKNFFGGVTCTSSCTNSCTSIISCLYNILWKEDIPSFPLMSSNINLDHCDCKFWLHHLIILFYNDNFPVNEQSVWIHSEMRSMTPSFYFLFSLSHISRVQIFFQIEKIIKIDNFLRVFRWPVIRLNNSISANITTIQSVSFSCCNFEMAYLRQFLTVF